mgnify:CR=1 FL=1
MKLRVVEEIEDWGLSAEDPRISELGQFTETGPVVECTRDGCTHEMHDPPAPSRRWKPRASKLVDFGEVGYGSYRYYALRTVVLVRHLPSSHDSYHHGRIEIVKDPAEIEHVVARLVAKKKGLDAAAKR